MSIETAKRVLQGFILDALFFSFIPVILVIIFRDCFSKFFVDDSRVIARIILIWKLTDQYSFVINPSKPNALIFGKKHEHTNLKKINRAIDKIVIQVVFKARNLSLVIDNTFGYGIHVSKCIK